jgi:hypothetical protein
MLAPLISPIVIQSERERIGDAVRLPPRKFVPAVVLRHMVQVFQRQRPTIIGTLSHGVGLAVDERRRTKMRGVTWWRL